MAKKKNDFQGEVAKVLDQAKIRFSKFSKDMGFLAKKSEKEIVKASRKGKIQLDIVSLNLQKEKLYYDIGKKVVALKAGDKLDIPELEPFWDKIRRLETKARKKKQNLSFVKKENNA